MKEKMKIIVAPDSFKESLKAKEVVLAIEEGIKRETRFLSEEEV